MLVDPLVKVCDIGHHHMGDRASAACLRRCGLELRVSNVTPIEHARVVRGVSIREDNSLAYGNSPSFDARTYLVDDRAEEQQIERIELRDNTKRIEAFRR